MAVIPFETKIDFMNPRWNRDAWARIQADMDSSKQRICHCSGTILAVRPGEAVKPFLGFQTFLATRLLPLLRNGGAEMARLGDQASDLGAVLDSDALEALRRTQLALGTVSLVFDGLRNRIAVAVAPTIEALANTFVALANASPAGTPPRSSNDTMPPNRAICRFARPCCGQLGSPG